MLLAPLLFAALPSTTVEIDEDPITLRKGSAEESQLDGLEVWVVDGPHYHFLVHGDDATLAYELAELAEAAYVELTEFFDREPDLDRDERLRAAFFPTREQWIEAIGDRARGLNDVTTSLYHPDDHTFSMVAQPLTYGSRRAVLDRVVFQYFDLARRNDRTIHGNTWYGEGLVGHLATHWWDGRTLELGVEPLFDTHSRRDAVRRSLLGIGREKVDLEDFLGASNAPSRPLGLALVAHIAQRDERGRLSSDFRAFRRAVEGGDDIVKEFVRRFGDIEDYREELGDWLAAKPETFSQVYGLWEPVLSDRVIGESPKLGWCRTLQPCGRIAADISWPIAEGTRAGVVLGHENRTDALVALVDHNGSVSVARVGDGTITRLDTPPFTAQPDGRGAVRMTAKFDGERVRLSVGGKVVGEWAATGESMGLAVESGRVEFGRVEVDLDRDGAFKSDPSLARDASDEDDGALELVRSGDTWIATTQHCELHVQTNDRALAAEYGAFVEAATVAVCEYFDRWPDLASGEKLVGRILRDRDSFLDALGPQIGDRLHPQTKSLYVPSRRALFLVEGPLEPWWRRAVLQMLVLQVYNESRDEPVRYGGNNWYFDGLAYHLQHHRWDGETVDVGVGPAFARSIGRLGVAERLGATGADAFDLGSIIASSSPPDRAVSEALIAFLDRDRREGRPASRALRGLMRALDGDERAEASVGARLDRAFHAEVGDPAGLAAELAEWLQDHPELFGSTTGSWDSNGPETITGAPPGPRQLAWARSVVACSAISTRVAVPESAGSEVGLLLHESSAEGFVVATIAADGLVRVVRVRNGAKEELTTSDAVRASLERSGRAHLDATHDGQWLRLECNGTRIGEWQLPVGRMGLAVVGERAVFEEVEVEGL